MNKRLVWCALGGVLSALVFWAVTHASEPPFQDFDAILLTDDFPGAVVSSQKEWAFTSALNQIEIGQIAAPSLVLCNWLRDRLYEGWYRRYQEEGISVGHLTLTPCKR